MAEKTTTTTTRRSHLNLALVPWAVVGIAAVVVRLGCIGAFAACVACVACVACAACGACVAGVACVAYVASAACVACVALIALIALVVAFDHHGIVAVAFDNPIEGEVHRNQTVGVVGQYS
mgnify:CR=1 FL=1